MKACELVDLVDDNGQVQVNEVPINIAGDTYPELHLQIAITVVFDSARRVLAQRRALTKRSDWGYIDHVCGVVSANELPGANSLAGGSGRDRSYPS